MKKKSIPLSDAYASVLRSEAGQMVLKDILSFTGVWRGGFVPDQNAVYFKEGARNVGLRIVAMLAKSSPANAMMVLSGCHKAAEVKQEEQGEANDENQD